MAAPWKPLALVWLTLLLPLATAGVNTVSGAGTGAWPHLVGCNELLATPFQLTTYAITGGLWHTVIQADRPTSCLSDVCRLSGDPATGWTTHDCNALGTLTIGAVGAVAPNQVTVRYVASPWSDLFMGNATVQQT